MKFLVTGSAGLVGRQVIKDLLQSYPQVYSCYHDSKPEDGIATALDLANRDEIIKVLDSIKPDVIIHLAGMTNVDQCETEKELALELNARSTAILSEQASKHDIFLVYVSTDYVFDGNKGRYKESDEPIPVDYYGRTKLEGEKAVRDKARRWCIARTSTPFGIHETRKSFPLYVAENLAAKKEISAITNQFTSPTYTPNLSKMLIEISTREISGIIHVSGATRISRYDVAKMVANKLGLDDTLLKQVKLEEMKWTAKRPLDSSLDVSKARSLLKEKPISIEEGLGLFIQELRT